MIAIVNKGPINNKQDQTGYYHYNIYLNKKLITSFIHKRSDMMEVCLEKAAMAIRKKEYQEFQEAYTRLHEPVNLRGKE
jgi:hypothetical protein